MRISWEGAPQTSEQSALVDRTIAGKQTDLRVRQTMLEVGHC